MKFECDGDFPPDRVDACQGLVWHSIHFCQTISLCKVSFVSAKKAGEQINMGYFILPFQNAYSCSNADQFTFCLATRFVKVLTHWYLNLLLQVTSTTQKLLRRQLTVTAGYILETLDITTKMNISTLLTELKN